MFVIQILRQLAAVPLIIFRDLLSIIPIYNKLEVMRWICMLTGKADDALAYISALINACGAEAFSDAAFEQMEKYKDARFAVIVGMSYYNAQKYDLAKESFNRATQAGCKNEHELLMLKFLLAIGNDKPTMDNLLNEILKRKDLDTNYSQFAWMLKCWSLLEDREIDQAESVADKILEIQECGVALLVKWVASFKRNPVEAEKYFTKAKEAWQHQYFESSVAQGWFLLGNKQAAVENLRIAENKGFKPGNDDVIIEEIMQCKEYVNA